MTDMSEMGGLGDLLKQAQALMSAQQQAAEQIVEGVAGGAMVRVEMTGGGDVRRVQIDPKVVDPADVEMLEDLVLAALHDATAKARALSQQAMGGLDLGALGGMLGQ